jgi:nitroreductase
MNISFLDFEEILSPRTLLQARRLTLALRRMLFMTICWSGVLCSAYYTFVSRAFRREQQAVIYGFLQQLSEDVGAHTFFMMRRNVHRLEKGLLLQSRPVFALDYIATTVTLFGNCLNSKEAGQRQAELDWAGDILTEYFRRVKGHPIVEEARLRYDQLAVTGQAGKIPFKRTVQPPPISYDQFLKLAQHRKSVRWFLPKPVPRELLDQAVEAAALAPSSCNRQPFMYRLFDDPALVRTLSLLPHGTAGFHHNIPVLAAVVGDLSAYLFERDRHGIYVDGALSIMSFMHALESLGLSSCPLNWPDIEQLERRAEKALNLRRFERVIMFIAIGYPDPEGLVAFSGRKVLDQMRRYN